MVIDLFFPISLLVQKLKSSNHRPDKNDNLNENISYKTAKKFQIHKLSHMIMK